jgi:RNA polymerase sigma-70 factor (sigma-E family)
MPVLEAVELKEFFQPPVGLVVARTPGSLLAAGVEAVNFTGRENELNDLTVWRDGSDQFSVLLVAGEGGQGKTRLAREFAHRTRRAGWVAGFISTASVRSADERSHVARKFASRLCASGQPILAIADYAEIHPDDIATIVSDLLDSAPPSPVRLLLLSRATGSWWTKLDEILNAEDARVIELPPLAAGLTERREAYAAAVTGLAHHLERLSAFPIGHEPAQIWALLARRLVHDPPDLSNGRLGNALTLHMTALTDLLTVASGEVPQRLIKSEEHELLRHERDYLQRAANRRGLLTRGVLSTRTDPDDCAREAWNALERALAGLIVFGPCDSTRANAISELPAGEHAADIVAWLAALYPSPKEEETIGAVQPDRLAELLLGGILSRQTDLLGKIAPLTDGLDEAVEVLFTLLRTASHPQFTDIGKQMQELVITRPAPFARAAPVLAATLAHAASMQGLEPAVAALEVVARRVDAVLGVDNPRALAVAADVASAKLALLDDTGSPRPKRLTDFVLGRANDAVYKAEKEFNRYRELAKFDAGFLADLLAAALNTLGISYEELSHPRRPTTVTETLLAAGALMPQLIAPTASQRQSEEAVRDLFEANYRPLTRLAAILVRDTATAEEIVQDAFMALYRPGGKSRDAEEAVSYLRQVVINRSRTVLRRRTAAGKYTPKPEPDAPSAEQGAITLLEHSAVVSALRELPERQREVVVLRYYADLTEAEIAAAMGISRGTVKAHTARAMHALRTALESDS